MTISNLKANTNYEIVVTLNPIFSIESHLTNITLNNQKIGGISSTKTTILPGSSYEVTLVSNTGYDIDSVIVKVNNQIIQNAFDEITNKVTLNDVNGNIDITASAIISSGITTYTISKSLSHVTMDNSSKKINEGDSYNSSIVATNGYTLQSVKVTMGGTTIQDAYSDGNIHIENVSGNIKVVGKATQTLNPEPETQATAIIDVSPDYFADDINEVITIGQPWEYIFDIPTYTNGELVLPAYEYVSHSLTMTNGGTIQRDGNRFYTNNVTGNITGEIIYKVVDNAVYGYIQIGVWGALGIDDNLKHSSYHSAFSIKGDPGHTATIDYVEDGYTLTGSFVQAFRNAHFSKGIYTMDSDDMISREYVANGSLEWNPTTRKLIVKKPFFRTLNDYGIEAQASIRICMGVNSKSNHPPMQSRIEFLREVGTPSYYHITPNTIGIETNWNDPYYEIESGEETPMDNLGISRTANIPYGQTYTQNGVEGYYIIPYTTDYILDTSKGNKGITVLDIRTGLSIPFTFTPNSSYIHSNILTIPNVNKPMIISYHCKPNPSVTTAKLEYQGNNIPYPHQAGTDYVENIFKGGTWVHEFEGNIASIDLWMYGDYTPNTSNISFTNNILTVSNITGNIRANVTFK